MGFRVAYCNPCPTGEVRGSKSQAEGDLPPWRPSGKGEAQGRSAQGKRGRLAKGLYSRQDGRIPKRRPGGGSSSDGHCCRGGVLIQPFRFGEVLIGFDMHFTLETGMNRRQKPQIADSKRSGWWAVTGSNHRPPACKAEVGPRDIRNLLTLLDEKHRLLALHAVVGRLLVG